MMGVLFLARKRVLPPVTLEVAGQRGFAVDRLLWVRLK